MDCCLSRVRLKDSQMLMCTSYMKQETAGALAYRRYVTEFVSAVKIAVLY